MADSFIIIDEPAVTDKKLDTEQLTVGANTVERERVQIAGAAATAIAGVDSANGLDVDVTRLPALVAGTANIGDVDIASPLGAGTEAAAVRVTIATDSTGVLSVDDNAGSLTIDNATLSVTGGGVEASALRVTIASDSTGVLSIDDNAGSITIDGTVAISSLPASTNTLEVVGDVAHNVAAAGNPVLVAGIGETMADSAPGNRADTDADAVRVATDLDGAVYTHPHGPQVWSYHENSSLALTDASVHAAPGVGLSLYVTDIVCSTGAATALNVFFEEGVTTVLGPYYLEAVAGRGLALHFQTPKKITANTALTITTSAAIAHGIDVTGFIAPG